MVDLKRYIDFEAFRGLLEKELESERQRTGRPPYDVVFMFKILILQRLYSLSDEQLEYQINDRESFKRFLDLHMGSAVPDYSSIWRFRERLTETGVAKKLFDAFVQKLEEQGVITKAGTIVDASFVEVPRQRRHSEGVRPLFVDFWVHGDGRGNFVWRWLCQGADSPLTIRLKFLFLLGFAERSLSSTFVSLDRA